VDVEITARTTFTNIADAARLNAAELCASVACNVRDETGSQQLAEAQARIAELTDRIADLEATAASTGEERDTRIEQLTADIAEARTQLIEAQTAVGAAEERAATDAARIAELTDRIADLEATASTGEERDARIEQLQADAAAKDQKMTS
jgi:chromosome segregation ATPase